MIVLYHILQNYLQNKCNEFKNLLPYCQDTNHDTSLYETERILQLNCLQNLTYVGHCKQYLYNSSRLTLKIPITLTIKDISLNRGTEDMEMTFSVNNTNPLDTELVSITYRVFIPRDGFFVDVIGDDSLNVRSCAGCHINLPAHSIKGVLKL